MERRDVAVAVASAASFGVVIGVLFRDELTSRRRRRRGGPDAVCRQRWLTSAPQPGVPRVVLVATGSVAAVKVPELAVALAASAEVVVVLTAVAERMHRRGGATEQYAPAATRAAYARLQTEAGGHRVRVLTDADEWGGYADVKQDTVVHVELRKWADALVVAPASANTLGKAALGLCDNLATCLLRAWEPALPLLLAPAMNTQMWLHPSTEAHLEALRAFSRSLAVVPPVEKALACGDIGYGALAAVEDIVAVTSRSLEGYEERRAQLQPARD